MTSYTDEILLSNVVSLLQERVRYKCWSISLKLNTILTLCIYTYIDVILYRCYRSSRLLNNSDKDVETKYIYFFIYFAKIIPSYINPQTPPLPSIYINRLYIFYILTINCNISKPIITKLFLGHFNISFNVLKWKASLYVTFHENIVVKNKQRSK